MDWYREQQRLRDIRVWQEQEPTEVPEDYRWHYQRSTADNSAKSDDSSSLELIEKGGYCIGNPDDCIRYLEQFEPTGLDEMMPLFQIGPITHPEVIETLSLFGRYVIPHFQDKAKTERIAGTND